MILTGRYKKVFFWVVIAFVLFTVTGFFVVPPILKSVLVKQLSTNLGRDVSVGKVHVNPYTLGVRIKAVTIREREGPGTFFSVDELKGRIGVSIVTGVITLHDLYLKNPYIKITRKNAGSYNISDLLEKEGPREPAKPEKGSDKISFSLRNIKIDNGSADFVDEPVKKKHTLREFNLSVPFLSNLPKNVERNVRPTLSFKLNDDPYMIQGTTKPFADSLETVFSIDLKEVDIPDYLAYAPVKMRFSVPSGYVNAKLELAFRQYANKKMSLSLTGNLSLLKLVVNDEKGKPVINLPALNVSMRSFEPFERKLALSKVSVESPELTMKRGKGGALNIMALLPEVEGAGGGKDSPKQQNKAEKKDGSPPFQCVVDVVEIKEGKVLLNDQSLPEVAKVTVEKLEVKGEGISLGKGSGGTFSASFLLNKRGVVKADGKFVIDPFSAEAKVDLKGVDIRPFQPYFADRVKVSVTSGKTQANGDLSVTAGTGKKGLSARFKGKASVTGFSCVDKETADSLFRMRSLFVNNIDFRYNPTGISIRGVSLSDFFAHITIKADRTANIQGLLVQETPPQADQAVADLKPSVPEAPGRKKEKPVPVKVDTITLQGGTIRFRDHSVKPAFSGKLARIGGRISGLSSDENAMADVELRGLLDDSAPLEIIGKINPLREDLYVDLKASFKDIELSPATPYSGRYIGYAIDKGKLSLDVKYLIEKRKLDSQNVIFIDQLTLGESIESPDATKLPVKLAIVLLRDRNGQIKLDIPVEGSLDDPKFSVWRIVIKMIVNLLSKAATAPFALLGSLFGGGEELGYVEFDYGRASLTGANIKKVDTIVKILQEKPSLKLEIEGHADKERDREGLKHYIIQKKVRAQKLKDLMKKSSEDIPIDDVKVEPQEYEKYLRRAYKAEKFPKPRNMIGFEKTIPVAEMEKLMLTNTQIKEDDLRSLARDRSLKIEARILKGGQGRIDAGRIFIVEPKTLAPEKKGKLKDSRVDFRLK